MCRSDWHAWQGHDGDVVLPHVPGHELAGTVVGVGASVRSWAVGARVTVPFVCACGACAACAAGEQQVCEQQTQPGFTHWGSFAELVALRHADVNLVALPDGMPAAVAASLGCRFATAYRAIGVHGRVAPGDAVAVHGCGGVGLSAVMIAAASGARVVAVDPSAGARQAASRWAQRWRSTRQGSRRKRSRLAWSRPPAAECRVARRPGAPGHGGGLGARAAQAWAAHPGGAAPRGPRAHRASDGPCGGLGSSSCTAATAWRRTSTPRCWQGSRRASSTRRCWWGAPSGSTRRQRLSRRWVLPHTRG